MKVAIAYVSPSGTTAALAKALGDALEARGQEARLLDIGRPGNRPGEPGALERWEEDLAWAEVLGIGSPVYHLRLLEPAHDFLGAASSRGMLPGKVFAFAAYGGICSGGALRDASRLARKGGRLFAGALKVAAPHFYKKTPFPDEEALRSVNRFADGLVGSLFAAIAPDRLESELALRGAAAIAYRLAPLVGFLRRLPIDIDAQACLRCGACARDCPSGAIRIAEAAVRDPARCLYCYHCSQACPVGAIHCPIERLEAMVKVNEGLLGRESPSDGFIVGYPPTPPPPPVVL
jgi:ferredoxin